MYNRYLPEAPEPAIQQHPSRSCGSGAGGFSQLLGGRLQGLRLDADTIIVLAVIWFLLSDGEIVQTDVLIIVALLFLLGL